MSSSHSRVRTFRRAALFIVPLYLIVAAGFYFSPPSAFVIPVKTGIQARVSDANLDSRLATLGESADSGNDRKRDVASRKESGIISRVIDGDTIDVLLGEKIERVRLIGIDTPETVDPRKPVQCFGKEASMKTEELLPQGMIVALVPDSTQDDRDKYARLLRYVIAPDGTDIELALIRQGYAREYTYHSVYVHQAEFKAAEKEAQNAGRGMWARGACPAGM